MKIWLSKVKSGLAWVFYMFVMPLVTGVCLAMGWRC